MRIHKLNYSNTNTYLIEGDSDSGKLLFDTGWAGTFPAFCRAMGEIRIPVQDINFILISHFHPDHMGIAQDIADQGPVILAADVQKDFLHSSDAIFFREKNTAFRSIEDDKVRFFSLTDSRKTLREIGIAGQILHTPGHSDDSISLMLDDGNLFVGDLNPLYELELHEGTQIGESWQRLLALEPKVVYY
ncbi:MAG: MBL fold metallo-hydrolase, partial [Lachnospiraceae bacterium]|nr:MBL fold metallo-hydrolase [Lachnospiraceae bacterium]